MGRGGEGVAGCQFTHRYEVTTVVGGGKGPLLVFGGGGCTEAVHEIYPPITNPVQQLRWSPAHRHHQCENSLAHVASIRTVT